MRRDLSIPLVDYYRPRPETLRRLADRCARFATAPPAEDLADAPPLPVRCLAPVTPTPHDPLAGPRVRLLRRGLAVVTEPTLPPRPPCRVCRDDAARVNGGTCAACGRARA